MENRQHLDRRLVSAGSRSFGIVTRSQLLNLGCTSRQIDYRVERGSLWPAFRATYSVGVPAPSWHSIWMAAVLASGPGAMLAGVSAAALQGLTDERPRQVDVHRRVGNNRTGASNRTARGSVELRVWRRTNCPEIPSLVHGIPVLPVPDLLVDLASGSTPAQLESFVSAASQKRYLNKAVVSRLIEGAAGRKGIKDLRFQLRFWDEEMGNALSILETKFIAVCRARGIEVPATNRWICGLMVDFVWLRKKLVVELDGYSFHGDRVAFERDHDRPAILMREGYLRLAFTWRQIVDRPDEVVATVLAAMATWNP